MKKFTDFSKTFKRAKNVKMQKCKKTSACMRVWDLRIVRFQQYKLKKNLGAFRIMGHSALWHYGQVNPLFVVFFQFELWVDGLLSQNYLTMLKNTPKKWGRDGGVPHFRYQTSEARFTHFFRVIFKFDFRLGGFSVKALQPWWKMPKKTGGVLGAVRMEVCLVL